MDLVDSHCHVISDDESRYPHAPLGGRQSTWAMTRPLTLDELLARMDEAGIGQAVLVQATTAYGYDNSYAVDSVGRSPDRLVAVGTFDPLAAEAPARLADALSEGLAGVRLFTTGSTVSGQAEWFADRGTYPFWAAAADLGVTVCLQMRLGPVTVRLRDLLERFPAVTIVLDHCGYPDIAASPARAGASLADLGRYPGLHLKLTHRAADFLEPVLEAFGSDRISWGSNCPAAEQSLGELVELASRVLAGLPADTLEDIFTGTSRRLYRGLASRNERLHAHTARGAGSKGEQ
jgi:predicted TIM-barrel fold metal-dependent hydrolase